MKRGSKPVIILGYGVRASGVDPRTFLTYGVPVLTSWQGMDLVDNRHPMYFGRPGIYGQRCANRVLYEADQVIAVGCRLSPWTIGHAGLRPEQQLIMVDVDVNEVARFNQAVLFSGDIEQFMRQTSQAQCNDWTTLCNAWRFEYPWIESGTHDDTPGYMNSYRIMGEIEKHLRPDEVIVADNGSLICPVFQALHVKPPQRVLTSGGLGLMGCGLPAAIGASFARDKGEVLCLVGDGGMMLNMQELQTIAHHQLPIKIIIFENDGYSMIKGTHKNMNLPYAGVDRGSGVSMPDFCKLAAAFNFSTCSVTKWETLRQRLGLLFHFKGPFVMVVHIDPEQEFVPRLKPIVSEGKITPARFDQLSPISKPVTLVEADLA